MGGNVRKALGLNSLNYCTTTMHKILTDPGDSPGHSELNIIVTDF